MYHNPFWIDFRKCEMQLQDSQLKLPGILLQFFTHSNGCQGQVEFSTKYPSSVTVLHQILVPKTCPWSCKFVQHWDGSIFPVTTTFFVCHTSIKTKTFSLTSFSYAGPLIWNKLPYEIKVYTQAMTNCLLQRTRHWAYQQRFPKVAAQTGIPLPPSSRFHALCPHHCVSCFVVIEVIQWGLYPADSHPNEAVIQGMGMVREGEERQSNM